MSNYKVRYESKPGVYTHYSGIKTVAADCEGDAKEQAFRMIRKSFPDRTRSMWIFNVIEKK